MLNPLYDYTTYMMHLGTSMASPHVAGLAAYFLSMEEDDDVSPKVIKDKILKTATRNMLTNIPRDTPNLMIYNDFLENWVIFYKWYDLFKSYISKSDDMDVCLSAFIKEEEKQPEELICRYCDCESENFIVAEEFFVSEFLLFFPVRSWSPSK